MLASALLRSVQERRELQSRARSQVLRAGDVRRTKLNLMLSEGKSWSLIQQAMVCSSAYISRWQSRFEQQRLAGLFARHRRRPAQTRTLRLEARILAWTRRRPDAPATGAAASWPRPGDQTHDGGADLAARWA